MSNTYKIHLLSKKNEIQQTFEFSDETHSIFMDDNIGTIKLKLHHAMNQTVSIDEIYLFAIFDNVPINPITLHAHLTFHGKIPFTLPRMNQLLLNLVDNPLKIRPSDANDSFTYEDILELKLTNKTFSVYKPLGHDFMFDFVCNPFQAIAHHSIPEVFQLENNQINNRLLLEQGQIRGNEIYACLAQDVFEMLDGSSMSRYASRIYFPLLYGANVDDFDGLEEKKSSLLKATRDLLTKDTLQLFRNIQMFHTINQMKRPSSKCVLNRRETGIRYFKAVIHPELKVKIPVEVIFKLIHASPQIPFIKYNLEQRQDKMYRLFAPQLTTDGRNIPFLKKAMIFKLIQSIGKTKCVAIYTIIQYMESKLDIICEFFEDGTMTVYPLQPLEIPIESVNISDIVRAAINPLIAQIQPYFEQSGLEIALFDSIQSSQVEIKELSYQFLYKIMNKINVKKIVGCLSSLFTIESKDYQKNIVLRYKRVSNYNKRDSLDAFIIEKIDQGLKMDDIVVELIQQFQDMSETGAREAIAKLQTELGVTGTNKKRALKFNVNPGFQTLMNVNTLDSTLSVQVNGINNIRYLEVIPIYIDAIVHIMQDKSSCGVSEDYVDSLCNVKKEMKEVVFEELLPTDDDLQAYLEDDEPIEADLFLFE